MREYIIRWDYRDGKYQGDKRIKAANFDAAVEASKNFVPREFGTFEISEVSQ
jgi:hypothetical protein